MNKLLISSCLLGQYVRYDGKIKRCNNPLFDKIIKNCLIYPVCPEVDGGLSVPRPPSEIITGSSNIKILNKYGDDVTSFFLKGAKKALDTALENDIKVALLKSKSPSCSNNYVYDGTFSKKLVIGEGISVSLLKKYGITVFNESQLDLLWKFMSGENG